MMHFYTKFKAKESGIENQVRLQTSGQCFEKTTILSNADTILHVIPIHCRKSTFQCKLEPPRSQGAERPSTITMKLFWEMENLPLLLVFCVAFLKPE